MVWGSHPLKIVMDYSYLEELVEKDSKACSYRKAAKGLCQGSQVLFNRTREALKMTCSHVIAKMGRLFDVPGAAPPTLRLETVSERRDTFPGVGATYCADIVITFYSRMARRGYNDWFYIAHSQRAHNKAVTDARVIIFPELLQESIEKFGSNVVLEGIQLLAIRLMMPDIRKNIKERHVNGVVRRYFVTDKTRELMAPYGLDGLELYGDKPMLSWRFFGDTWSVMPGDLVTSATKAMV